MRAEEENLIHLKQIQNMQMLRRKQSYESVGIVYALLGAAVAVDVYKRQILRSPRKL